MSAMNTSQIATGAMSLQPAALAAQPVSLCIPYFKDPIFNIVDM